MRKFLFLLIMTFFSVCANSEELKLIKIIKNDFSRSFRFIGDDLLFYKAKETGFFYYNFCKDKISFFKFPEVKKYQVLKLDEKNRLILGLSDEKPNAKNLSNIIFYNLEIKNDISKKIDLPQYNLNSINQKYHLIIKKIEYEPHKIFAKIGDYYLIANDVLNHGIEVNTEAPEKHAYHDMDLCLVNENGDVCAVLPFTVDDQTVGKLSILESSPDEKLVKIKASSSYSYAKINDKLLEKYPELKKGLYYFIYEITDDPIEKKVECIDLTSELNLVEGKEINIKSDRKDFSDFDIKIIDDSIQKETAEQKKSKSAW